MSGKSPDKPPVRQDKESPDNSKFHAALLKMNKWEIMELVNSPTSRKSKMLMEALLKDHKNVISEVSVWVKFEKGS